MHEEVGMSAIIQVVLWIVGVGLSVISFVALMQLFSISKSLKLIVEELRRPKAAEVPELVRK